MCIFKKRKCFRLLCSLSFIAAFHAGNITLFLDLNTMSGPRKKTEGKQQQHLSMASGVSVTVKLKDLNFSRCQFKAHIIVVLQQVFFNIKTACAHSRGIRKCQNSSECSLSRSIYEPIT